MISKPILMLSLSVLAGLGLTLDASLSPISVNFPSDPRITLTRPNATSEAATNHATRIAPHIDEVNTTISPSTAAVSVPTQPQSRIEKPSRGAQTLYPYTALPFSPPIGNVAASASSTTWQLSQINAAVQSNPSLNSGPIVAIIDTGFALSHSSLAGHWWTNPGEIGATTQEGLTPNCTSRGLPLDKSCNNLDNDGDGYASDWRGYDFANTDNSPQAGETAPNGTAVYHGTFVAGLVGATATASSAGVDQSARLMPLQALDDNGDGDTYTVSDAIVYAAEHHAAIINLSLGAVSDDPYMHQAIDYAIALGSVVVAAAGNSGNNLINYPANYPEVVAVGASDSTDIRASFSSYGPNLDLLAPGQGLCSTSWTSTNQTSSFVCGGNGTSFATPIVSAALARLLTSGGSASLVAQFADVTADKTAAMNSSWRTDQYGTGRLNLGAAATAQIQAVDLTSTNAIVRYTCSGNTNCQRQIRDYLGNISEITAKNITAATSSVYWQSTSNSSTPTVWSVYDSSANTVLYYSVL